jgi:hypothetical protein
MRHAFGVPDAPVLQPLPKFAVTLKPGLKVIFCSVADWRDETVPTTVNVTPLNAPLPV